MTTSLQAAELAYAENADYDEVGSITKARAFVTACRKLLALRATTVTKGPNSMSQPLDVIQKELERARGFVLDYSESDRVGPSLTKADFTTFRS